MHNIYKIEVQTSTTTKKKSIHNR